VTNQRGIRVDTQAVIQQQLLEVGIGTELINVESSVLFGSFSEGGIIAVGDYDLGQWSQTTSFPDPNTSVFLCSQIPTPESPEGGNYRGYCNPELDALFDQANQETDPAARTELFHQISRLIYDEYIYVGIWYDADNWEISTRLENVRINALYPFWNITEWDLAG
jgi:peptide/nickel transport system substrate-binding protein